MDKKVELVAPGGVEQLRVVDCAPREPGRGEIRIRQQVAGVNYIDIYQRTGLYPLPLPAVLGVEGAGVVEAVGEEVRHIAVGDRVVYAGLPGGYASTRVLPAWRAIPLPTDISMEQVAGVILRGLTAHMLLTRTYPAGHETTVLVHAAAGGLGTLLVRWGKSLGCTVIGTVGSAQKAGVATANGADHLIIGRDADLIGEVAHLTRGKGVDFVVDGIGGDVLAKSLGCARKFGVVASVGQAAGPIPAVPVEDLGPMRTLSLARPSVMAYAAEQDTYKDAMQAVLQAIRRGIIPKAAHHYPLTQAASAQEDLERGRTTGAIALTV